MKGTDRAIRRRGRVGEGSGNSGVGAGPGRGRGRNRLKPGILMLEDRRRLSTFAVTNAGDTTDGSGNPVVHRRGHLRG